MQSVINQWHTLSYPTPQKLNPASQEFHHAAQFIAMIGNSYLPHQSDDSHTNMEWLPALQALAGNWIQGKEKARLALSFPDFRLSWLDDKGKEIALIALNGMNKKAISDWLKQTSQEKLALDAGRLEPISHFEIPYHPVDDGAAFAMLDPIFCRELAAYRHNANAVLEHFSHQFEHASMVRTWPHHFDIGVYIPVAFDANFEVIKSVGIGLAIPDKDVSEHYFYVNHWQKEGKTDTTKLPELSDGGYWHTKNWTGAILPVSALLRVATAEGQAKTTAGFLQAAIDASLNLINA